MPSLFNGLMGRQRGVQGAGAGPLGTPTTVTGTNTGAQGVVATRTATGVEASFTTTSLTFPVSARPKTVAVSVSAASALVQVGTVGNRFTAGMVQSANPPLVIDVSALPPGSSVAVETEATAACVIGILATYGDV